MIKGIVAWINWESFINDLGALFTPFNLDKLAQVVASNGFIALWCGLLFAYFLINLSLFAIGSLPVMRSLFLANRELLSLKGEKGFTLGFEVYDTDVRKLPKLQRAWSEFVKSLVLPEPGADNLVIRNTAEPSQFINETTIIEPSVRTRFFSSVPSHLMAAGILGTFVGLAAGIGGASQGLTAENPIEVQKALGHLLDGASLAFLTSIFGIGSSLAFMIIERLIITSLNRGMEAWCTSLGGRIRLLIPETIQQDQLREAKRQTLQLERFNNELVFALEQALEEKIAGKLVPKLETLIQAVEGLRQDQSDSTTRAVENMVSEFTRGLTARAGSDFDSMSSTIAKLNSTLEGSIRGMERSQTQMIQTLDSMVASMKDVLSSGSTALQSDLSRAMGQVTESLMESAAALSAKLEGAGTHAAEQISGSLQGFQTGVGTLKQTTEATAKLMDGMEVILNKVNTLSDTLGEAHRQFQSTVEPIQNVVRGLSESGERVARALDSTTNLVERIVGSVESLGSQQDRITNAWESYQDRFEGIDISLTRTFEQMDEGLRRYTDQVRQFVTELDFKPAGLNFSLARKDLKCAPIQPIMRVDTMTQYPKGAHFK